MVSCSIHKGINSSQSKIPAFSYLEGWEPELRLAFHTGRSDFTLILPRELISRLPVAGKINQTSPELDWLLQVLSGKAESPCKFQPPAFLQDPILSTHGPSLYPVRYITSRAVYGHCIPWPRLSSGNGSRGRYRKVVNQFEGAVRWKGCFWVHYSQQSNYCLPKLMIGFRTGRRQDSDCNLTGCNHMYPRSFYSYYASVKFSIQLSYHHSILLIL